MLPPAERKGQERSRIFLPGYQRVAKLNCVKPTGAQKKGAPEDRADGLRLAQPAGQQGGPAPDGATSSSWIHRFQVHHLLVVLLLLAVDAAIYLPTRDLGYFTLDDPDYVVNNPQIDSLDRHHVARMLSEPYFA